MTRGREAVTRQAHNLKIGGSIPSSATRFMIVKAIFNVWNEVNNRYRKIVNRVVEDPETHVVSVETEAYFYDKTGKVKEPDVGNNVDKKV